MFKIALVFLFFNVVEANDQSAAAKGVVTCDGDWTGGVEISLWDKDWLDPDDLMANTTLWQNNHFYLEGFTGSISTIKPELRFRHNCTTDRATICSKIIIPQIYVTEGQKPTKIFDTGNVMLEKMPNDCKLYDF